jgi:hypothetical protein
LLLFKYLAFHHHSTFQELFYGHHQFQRHQSQQQLFIFMLPKSQQQS